MGKVDAPHPERLEQREALDASDDKLAVSTFYEIRNYHGERKYLTNDKADAEARLRELAVGRGGIGADGEGEPPLTLSTVQAVEVENFEKDGPESRTRGKRSGKVDED